MSVSACIILFGYSVTAHADELADKAYRILEKRCYDCHGVDYNFENLDVLNRKGLIADRGKLKKPFVSPGKPEDSKLLTVIENGVMPIDGELPADETAVLREWISKGASFPEITRTQRPFISEREILDAILTDQRNIRERTQREYTRYFSLAHLHNNPDIDEKHLRYTRAALSKSCNSLSHQPAIVLPRAVNESQTIFAVNLQDVGWDFGSPAAKGWLSVLKRYPYCVTPTTDLDAGETYGQIIAQFKNNFSDAACYIRADWFIDAATQPPLYNELAMIPETLDELAYSLGIKSLEANIANGNVKRAAVLKSGVSAQNRLMDRHTGLKTLWVSYDFALNSGRSNIAQFPLGPKIDSSKALYEFNQHAFEEDGSELIWELKNGLHGYMIVDGKGDRIDRAPVSIVWNKALANGNPEVINGATCMGCHTKGIRDFDDILREGHGLSELNSVQFLSRIVPKKEEMYEQYVEPDRQKYLIALKRATGPFLQVGEDRNKDITAFPEPVSKVIAQFNQPLNINAVASEIGLDNPLPREFARLRAEGMSVLGRENGAIQRTFWAPTTASSQTVTTTIFQKAVKYFALGNPISAHSIRK